MNVFFFFFFYLNVTAIKTHYYIDSDNSVSSGCHTQACVFLYRRRVSKCNPFLFVNVIDPPKGVLFPPLSGVLLETERGRKGSGIR